MLLNIPPNLPAIKLLEEENIFLSTDNKRLNEKPLKIALVNLMPVKITTETDFIRLLSNSPFPIELDFVKMKSHQSKNTSQEHLNTFYKNFEEIQNNHYNGLIVTGAPVELINFEDVNYWTELQGLFDWAHMHDLPTLYICWAAQAALYHFYKIPKYSLDKKMFGIFKHTHQDNILFRGFDDEFYAPHSRHTEIRKEDIIKHPELTILSEAEDAGVFLVSARNGKDIFITGHLEYARETLHNEYIRDVNKGLPINIPDNYYVDNNPKNEISVKWYAHANLLYSNWLNYARLNVPI